MPYTASGWFSLRFFVAIFAPFLEKATELTQLPHVIGSGRLGDAWPGFGAVLAGIGGGLALQMYMRGLGWFWGLRVLVEVFMICAGGFMAIMLIMTGLSGGGNNPVLRNPIRAFLFQWLSVFIMCAGVFAMGEGAVYNVYLLSRAPLVTNR